MSKTDLNTLTFVLVSSVFDFLYPQIDLKNILVENITTLALCQISQI